MPDSVSKFSKQAKYIRTQYIDQSNDRVRRYLTLTKSRPIFRKSTHLTSESTKSKQNCTPLAQLLKRRSGISVLPSAADERRWWTYLLRGHPAMDSAKDVANTKPNRPAVFRKKGRESKGGVIGRGLARPPVPRDARAIGRGREG